MKISTTSGHLTATNKRHIRALMSDPVFEAGRRFRVNRIDYFFVEGADSVWQAIVSQVRIDDWGRRYTDTHRATFKVAT